MGEHTMAKEIMLNKSFIGSWGVESDENIPHEIINLFKSDNGNIYIYVPPYGGFQTKEHPEVSYVLLTGSWNNNMTEIFYVAKNLKLLHNGGKKATRKDRELLVEQIKNDNIKYGGKYLHEIKMAENEEENIFYLTFQVGSICKPKKKLFLSWSCNTEEHTDTKDIYELTERNYNYQRQIGYIPVADYNLVESIINDDDIWDTENDVVQSVRTVTINQKETLNFLKLIHKEYDETIFTNLFYEFFNSTPDLFTQFAESVLDIHGASDYSVKREVQTKDGKGRIDLLAESSEYVVVIENKINSGLNGIDKHNRLSQLTTYIEFVEREVLNGRIGFYYIFEPNYNDIDILRFDQKRGKEFSKIQYSKIYDFFNMNREKLYESPFGKYTDDFIGALYRHTLTMKDVVMQRFTDAIQK